MVVLRIESWCHLNRPSLITEMQLLRKWIWVWGLPHKSKLGESWIFQRAKLLMLLREKIGAFSRNWKYSPVECFVLLSCSLISLFRSEFRYQELIWQSLHLLSFHDTVISNVFHASYSKKCSHTLIFRRLKVVSHSNLVQSVDVTGKL